MATKKFYPLSVTSESGVQPYGGTDYIAMLTDGSDDTYLRMVNDVGHLSLGFDFSSAFDSATISAITAHIRISGYTTNLALRVSLDDNVTAFDPFAPIDYYQNQVIQDRTSTTSETDVVVLKQVDEITISCSFGGSGSSLKIYEFWIEVYGLDDWIPYVTIS